jgi:hypothetical protein
VGSAADGIVTDVTLTTIMPTLRASIPEPLEPSLWPAHTVATTADVCIAAISMARLADVVGTPCVHTAEQAPPRYRPRNWQPRDVPVSECHQAREAEQVALVHVRRQRCR